MVRKIATFHAKACFVLHGMRSSFLERKPFEMTAATELANEFSIHKSRYEMMIVGKMRSNFDVHPGGQACRFLLQKGGVPWLGLIIPLK